MAYNFHHENYNTYYHTEFPDKVFYGAGVYEPDAQTDLAIDFLERAVQRPEPFALFVSWGHPTTRGFQRMSQHSSGSCSKTSRSPIRPTTAQRMTSRIAMAGRA